MAGLYNDNGGSGGCSGEQPPVWETDPRYGFKYQAWPDGSARNEYGSEGFVNAAGTFSYGWPDKQPVEFRAKGR